MAQSPLGRLAPFIARPRLSDSHLRVLFKKLTQSPLPAALPSTIYRFLNKLATPLLDCPAFPVNTLWSLDDLANVRLKVEVHELAAKDALNKATAIASSIGFTKVVAKTVELKDSIKVAINSSSLFEETSQRAHAYQSGRRFADGCLLEDDEEVVPTSIRGDGKWTGCDDAGHLDVWRLVFAPKTITMHAKVEAKFSAISSTGWVYEEFNEHRFITS